MFELDAGRASERGSQSMKNKGKGNAVVRTDKHSLHLTDLLCRAKSLINSFSVAFPQSIVDERPASSKLCIMDSNFFATMSRFVDC